MNTVRAAVAVLSDTAGKILVARRPADKICPGKWEFPGGKIEEGESSFDAVAREIREELDVHVSHGELLISHVNRFPDRLVFLDVWLVRHWSGTPRSAEDQDIMWTTPDEARVLDFLPGRDAILAALDSVLVA
ncbi:MAG: hypothetical protein DHS20C01_08080 [marine bacterium B5-7]|nr:MAG: hypothetical protein DHS20C01_08080 [marine bacterium B5-7]